MGGGMSSFPPNLDYLAMLELYSVELVNKM